MDPSNRVVLFIFSSWLPIFTSQFIIFYRYVDRIFVIIYVLTDSEMFYFREYCRKPYCDRTLFVIYFLYKVGLCGFLMQIYRYMFGRYFTYVDTKTQELQISVFSVNILIADHCRPLSHPQCCPQCKLEYWSNEKIKTLSKI